MCSDDEMVLGVAGGGSNWLMRLCDYLTQAHDESLRSRGFIEPITFKRLDFTQSLVLPSLLICIHTK